MSANSQHHSATQMRVCLLGATGTIGRATLHALVRRGHDVVCFVRPRAGRRRAGQRRRPSARRPVRCRPRHRWRATGFAASASTPSSPAWPRAPARPGTPGRSIIRRMSTCWPRRERRCRRTSCCCRRSACRSRCWRFSRPSWLSSAALIASGLTYSIVRPTAFFKSLSGQIERVKQGKPFLVFGDGTLTACKPISDGDLADYLADCLDGRAPLEPHTAHRRAGRGDHAAPARRALFALLGREPRFRHVPVALLDAIIAALSVAGRLAPPLRRQGGTGAHRPLLRHRIDAGAGPRTGRYDAAATPSTGTETLFDFYTALVAGARGARARRPRGVLMPMRHGIACRRSRGRPVIDLP